MEMRNCSDSQLLKPNSTGFSCQREAGVLCGCPSGWGEVCLYLLEKGMAESVCTAV